MRSKIQNFEGAQNETQLILHKHTLRAKGEPPLLTFRRKLFVVEPVVFFIDAHRSVPCNHLWRGRNMTSHDRGSCGVSIPPQNTGSSSTVLDRKVSQSTIHTRSTYTAHTRDRDTLHCRSVALKAVSPGARNSWRETQRPLPAPIPPRILPPRPPGNPRAQPVRELPPARPARSPLIHYLRLTTGLGRARSLARSPPARQTRPSRIVQILCPSDVRRTLLIRLESPLGAFGIANWRLFSRKLRPFLLVAPIDGNPSTHT